jgi:hypothetical protein
MNGKELMCQLDLLKARSAFSMRQYRPSDLTAREIEKLMNCARKHSRYGH